MNWLQRLGLTTVAVVLLATVPVVGARPSCPSACCKPSAEAKTEGACCSKPTPAAESACCAPKAEATAETTCCPTDTESKNTDSSCGCFVAGYELPIRASTALVPVPYGDWVFDIPPELARPDIPPASDDEEILDAGDSSPPRAPLPPDAPRAPPAF